MCGIIGYFGSKSEVFSEKISLDIISHRGPDSSGSYLDKNLYLGHTRLSIQDLSDRASQPMFSKDKKYVIVFNGEIYNHNELRKSCLSDVEFQSTSDTETLLYGLIKFGKEFLNKLNGIFAFSFVDIETGDFLLVRDNFGVKPLYYYLDSNELFFSSEMKAILSYKKNFTINRIALANYLNFLWSPAEDTPFLEIKKLLPGHLIEGSIYKIKQVQIYKYYQIPFADKFILKNTESELIDLCENYLIAAVKRQMLSDVPVGFFLSGGLDSSLIVAIAKKILPKEKFECFTINSIGFDDEGFSNDLYYAKKVAKHIDVNLNIIDGSNNVLEFFDKIIYHLDEPQADAAPIYVYNICKAARAKGIRVLLGGTGGDDLFSGYRRHQALQMEKYFRSIPFQIRKFIKFISSKLNTANVRNRRIKKLFANIHKSSEIRIFSYFDWIDETTLSNLFKESFKYDKHRYFKKLITSLPKNTSKLNSMLFLELNTFLVDHNLNYTDKLSMATGVEVRVPFLDKELVEFSTKLPVDLKLNKNETKYILKKVAERYLPLDIIYRPKTGFGAPIRKWITEDMESLINKYLSKDKIEERNIFDYDKVQKLIKDNKSRKIDVSYNIWALLSIESWMMQFNDLK